MTTVHQIIRSAIPDAPRMPDRFTELCEHILWGMTPFPFGVVTAQSLYRAASRYRRAAANNIRLCDHCSNRAEPNEWCCAKCAAALRRGKEKEHA